MAHSSPRGRATRRFVLQEGDGALLRRIVFLCVPSMLEWTLQTCVTWADYIMVGGLGTQATASVGLTNEVIWLFKSLFMAAGIGLLSCMAQAYGAGRYDRLRSLAVQGLLMAVVTGGLITVGALALAPSLPRLLGASAEIWADSSRYFALIASAFLFTATDELMGYALRSTGDMKTPLLVNGTMNLLNVAGNFLLIFPSRSLALGGVTLVVPGAGLGVAGAALSTALAAVFGGVCMLVCVRRNPLLRFGWRQLRVNGPLLRSCVRVGLPAWGTNLTTCGGRVIFSSLIARQGTAVYAAHSLAFTAESAFYIPCVGMISAIATLAGQIKGEGDERKLRRFIRLANGFAALVMLVMAVLIMVFANQVIGLMSADAYVLWMAPQLLRIVALNEPVFAMACVMEAVFDGLGLTKVPFVCSSVAQWVVRVCGTYLCLFVWGLDVRAAWVCMIGDNILRGALLLGAYLLFKDVVMQGTRRAPRART